LKILRNGLMTVAAATTALALSFGAQAADDQVLKVGAASNLGGMVVFVAQDLGFFAKHGLDAKIEIRNTGSALTKSLRAGEIDISLAAFSNIPAALERGLDLRGVAGYTGAVYRKTTSDNFVGIVAQPNSGINSIKDLKGKKVGVAFGTTGDLWLQSVLKANGMSRNDITRINVRPPSFVSTFDSGGVDAQVAWEPGLTRAADKVKGSKIITRGGDYVCFCALFHGSPERIYGDRKKTQAFVDAIAETAAFVRDPQNLDKIASIGSRFVRGMTPELIKRTIKYVEFDPRLGDMTYKSFNQSVQLLIEQKKMKRPYDPKKYIDTSFIENTMKRHPEWFADLK
jgi:ABC-type nitrate/sulfonate/bicarbonate transport system substrate-binding protein